jgi:hypothetical protein
MPPAPEIRTRVDALTKELNDAIAHYNTRARTAYWCAQILMIMTLGSSALATLCGVFLDAGGKITGGIAALPGITALIAVTMKPAGRANWHYRKKDGLNELRRRLLYELPESPTADNVAAISNSWTQLTVKMNEKWERDYTLSWVGFTKASQTEGP